MNRQQRLVAGAVVSVSGVLKGLSFLFLLVASVLMSSVVRASATEVDENLDGRARSMAAYIFYEYLQYCEQHPEQNRRPFMVGVDGASSADKSRYLDRVNDHLNTLSRSYSSLHYSATPVVSFSVDIFLHSIEQRRRMFDLLGAGAVVKDEQCGYRLEEAKHALRRIVSGRPFKTFPYIRSSGGLGPATIYHTGDIVMVEGIHVLDTEGRAFFHLTICLDCDHQRHKAKRPFIHVVYTTLLRYILRPSESELQCRFEPEVLSPKLAGGLYEPSLKPEGRTLRHVRFNGFYGLIRFYINDGWPADIAENELQRLLRVLKPILGFHRTSPLPSVEQHHSDRGAFTLTDHDGLFASLSVLLGCRITTHYAVRSLERLSTMQRRGKLSDAQGRVLHHMGPLLDWEEAGLRSGESGSLISVMAVWAFLLDKQPPSGSLILVLNTQRSSEVWRLGVDGYFRELNQQPQDSPALIYNSGERRWTYQLPEPAVVHNEKIR